MLGCCLYFSLDTEAEEVEEETPVEIVETIKIIPDAEILAKEYVRATPDWDKDCSDDTLKLSYEDAQRLLKIAYAEGGDQGIQGQLMIMQTVWNRVLSNKFPNTIKAVIEQPSQFSSVSNGHYEKAVPTVETHLALAEFEKNLSNDENPIGFETVDNGTSLLSYFDFYTTYKDHNFYKLKND